MITKVLAVGFDALDYDLFSRFASQDYSIIPLYSPVPMTGPAWSSIYTGLSTTNHQISEGWGRKKSTFFSHYKPLDDLLWGIRKLAGYTSLKSRVTDHRTYATYKDGFLWDILSRNDIECKLFNLPCTYPPRKIKGIHVAGFPARGEWRLCYPPEVADHIPEDFCRKSDLIQYVSDPYKDGMGGYKPRLIELGFEKVLETAREHSFELLDFFIHLGECPFEMIQFSFVDRIAHAFSLEGKVLEGVYGLVKDILAYVDQNKECENLIIVSDHGFQPDGPVYGHTYYGTLAWKGLNLRTEFDLEQEATVKDFAPTVSALYDLTCNSDGRVIHEILDIINPEKFAKILPNTIEDLEEGKTRSILEKRLRDLGYF